MNAILLMALLVTVLFTIKVLSEIKLNNLRKGVINNGK
jgi:hypothetical protein